MNRKDQDTGSTTLDLSLGDERNTTKEKQCRNANLEKQSGSIGDGPRLHGNEF